MFKSLISILSGWCDPKRPLTRTVFLWVAAWVIVADQLSKLLVVWGLALEERVPLIPSFLGLWHRNNSGAAFSMFGGLTLWLALFSFIISVVIAVWGWRIRPGEEGLRLGLGLILGGAVGNLIDRVRLHHVVDFIDVHWFESWHYPTFNVADSGVCIGMALVLIASFRLPVKKDPQTGRP